MQHSHKKHTAKRVVPGLQVVLLGALSIVMSFALGIQSAGEVQTISRSAATDAVLPGDMNTDNMVDIRDVLIILECSQGYVEPTPTQLMADPDGDGTLTTDDALEILRDIAYRS